MSIVNFFIPLWRGNVNEITINYKSFKNKQLCSQLTITTFQVSARLSA